MSFTTCRSFMWFSSTVKKTVTISQINRNMFVTVAVLKKSAFSWENVTPVLCNPTLRDDDERQITSYFQLKTLRKNFTASAEEDLCFWTPTIISLENRIPGYPDNIGFISSKAPIGKYTLSAVFDGSTATALQVKMLEGKQTRKLSLSCCYL